jgi:predicted acyl esterase
VKLIDVDEQGRAFNLDETIQRMRYREGYNKPPVWMEKGKVYKVNFQPMVTSNYFAPGHRIRIEISSSNFPRFDRNLNTGGNNYDETKGVIAHIQNSTRRKLRSRSSKINKIQVILVFNGYSKKQADGLGLDTK